MDQNSLSSIYVAPLQINKGCAQSTTASERGDRSSCDHCSDGFDVHQFRQDAEPSGFHTYLRACFSYHPTCDDSSSTVTLPLNLGDIILIHSVHTNGWADGTLLSSGARGWLPTNYCEVYDLQPVRNLLKAMTRFWDLIGGISNGSLEFFGSHDYVRGLVAGVRCLLVGFEWMFKNPANTSGRSAPIA